MFSVRGYILDFSQGKKPTSVTIRKIVDLLSKFNYNRLVIETSRGDDVALPESEWHSLGAYCAMNGLELETVTSLEKKVTLLPLDGCDVDALRMQAVKCRTSGRDFYVCPSSCCGNSLSGRVENMRENMLAAESVGTVLGAKGFLVADWGGYGHWQPLAASLPAIVYGGALAFEGSKAAKMDLESALDGVMGVPLGGVLLRLGTLYLRGGALRSDASEFHNILAHDHGYSRDPRITNSILAEVSALAATCRNKASDFSSYTLWGEGSIWAQEIMHMADLVDAACHRRDEKRLRFLREEHTRIWRTRNREDGLDASIAKLPRF